MQISDNKEKGVELTWKHNSDITSIPLKKRPLVWIRSPSPPLSPSSPTKELNDANVKVSQACPTEEYKSTQLEPSLPVSGFLVSDFSSQKISTGTGNYEPPSVMSVSLESPHSSCNHGPTLLVDAASHVDSSCTGSTSNNTTFSQLTSGKLAPISKANEQSEKAFLEGSEERMSSDKSALQSVLGTAELSSLKEPQGFPPEANKYMGHVKQENVEFFYGNVQGMISEVEKSNKLKRVIAKRSDWDLNTTMDTWVGSLCNEGKNHAESGTHAAGERRKVKQETCSETMINKIRETIAESDKFSKLNDVSPSPYCTDANVNLHLSPCSKTPLHLTQRIHVLKTIPGRNLTDVSWIKKPSHPISKSVNTLPSEMNDHQKVTMKLVKSGKNTVFDKVVKSETCEEFPNESLGFGQNNSHYSSLPMKSEPKEFGYPARFKPDEVSAHDNESSTSYIKPPVHRKVEENTSQSDAKVSQSSLLHGDLACDLQLRNPSIDAFMDINVHVQSRLNHPGSGELDGAPSSETLPPKDNPLNENSIVESEFAESEKDGKAIANFDGDVLNNSAEKPSSDNLSNSVRINKTSEINRINNYSLDVNTNASIEYPKQKPQNKHKLGVQMILRETFDDDPILNGVVVGDKWKDACEGSANEKEAKHTELDGVADSRVNAGISTGTSHFDEKEQAIHDPKEDLDIQVPECIVSQCSKEIILHSSMDIQPSAVLTCENIENKYSNLNSNAPSFHLNRQNETEMEVCSRSSCEKGSTITDEVHSEYVSDKITVDDSKLPSEDLQIPSKSEKSNSADNETFGSQFSSGEASHLNSAPANISCEWTGDAPRKVILSQIEKQGFHRTAREEELLGSRSGGRPESRIYGKERKQNYIRKSGYDFSVRRGRFDQNDILHGDQDCSGYSFEPFNSSTRFRHNRPKIASETTFPDDVDTSIQSASRRARKFGNDNLENFSGQTSRRWSPRTREGNIPFDHQLAPKPMRGEEKFMRDFSNDTIDPSMIPNPRGNYDRRDIYVRRGRRSFFPDSRRGPPNFPRTYSPYSMRPHMRSPRLWSPQGPDEFDGQPELIPQSLQFERMVLPLGADSFPEYISDRRVGSPPFVSRLHDGMREVGNLREYDGPRTGRGVQRTIRRFHLIDPIVNEEEQYFDTLHPDHLNEILRDDEHVEGRNYDDCHGFVRPPSNRYYGDNGSDFRDNRRNFSLRIERGPSNPIRFRPDTAEEFSQRENSRERCFRSGMANASQRNRGLKEQENNYDADEVQGLQGPVFNDNPVKRRRI